MGSSHCFACGEENPIGLKLHFYTEGEDVVAEYLCQDNFVGWTGIQHGGITATLLDEISAYVPYFKGLVAVTAELTVSFVEPIRTGERITLRGTAIKENRKIIEVNAKIYNEQGHVKAHSHAKMMILSDKQQEEMGVYR